MKLALAQINPIIGGLDHNVDRILTFIEQARGRADLVVFPELCLTGYPPKDLLFETDFLEAVEMALHRVARQSAGAGVLLGAPLREGEKLYNFAVLLHEGKVIFKQAKTLLPTYDVFDERRYFHPAAAQVPARFKGKTLGISICEDIWNDKDFWHRALYEVDPLENLSRESLDLLINLSGSPYHYGKATLRLEMITATARKYGVPVVYVNQVGANDELVFDGNSFYANHSGSGLMLKSFQEDLAVIDTENPPDGPLDAGEDIAWIEEALVLGIRDYAAKTGFDGVVLGMSGGIDSSVVAVLAARALGPEKVLGVAMPSMYSSPGSRRDAEQLARNLGIGFRTLPISDIFHSFLRTLGQGETTMDLAEENLQARIRGTLLMFISNRENRLLLSTGNKSEIAVGYATLYGDMAGGLAPISDLPKSMIYELARHINRDGEILPEAVLTKPPSAELKPDQKDQDTLPPYDILDRILRAYVEKEGSLEDLVNEGIDPDLVAEVVRKVDRSEYKRKQAAPGLRVTSKSFGSGRRFPIAQGWDHKPG